MRKTSIGFVLGVLFLAVCFSAEAQQTKRVFRIGYLASSSPRRGFGPFPGNQACFT